MAFQSISLLPNNNGNNLYPKRCLRNQNNCKKTNYALVYPPFRATHHNLLTINHLVNLPQDGPSSQLLQNEGMATMAVASTDSAVMSTQDIVYGTILAFVLAYVWYLLNNDNDERNLEPSFWDNETKPHIDKKSNQLEKKYDMAESFEETGITNDIINEEIERETISNEKDKSTSVLNWKEISRPENYILYSTKVKQRLENGNSASSSSQSLPANSSSTKVVTEKKLILISLLVLFVPIFSIEFFFALSRQFLCGDPTLSLPISSSSWAQQLCSAHLEV